MAGEPPDSPFTAAPPLSSEDLNSSSRVRLLDNSHHFPTFGSGEHSLVHSFDRSDAHDANQSSEHLAYASQHQELGPTQSFVHDSGVANGSSLTSSTLAGKSSLAALSEQRVLWQQEEEFHRKQRAARRRYQLELEEMEHRLSEMATSARTELEQLGLIVEGHQHSATHLEEVLKRTMSGASQLSTMLSSKEQQTAELRDLVSEVSKTLHHMVSKVDAETHRIDELEKRVEGVRTSTGQLMDAESSLSKKGQDSKSLMHSIKKLENLVMRESDYRAAGIREVLEQVRGENSKKAHELESHWKADLESFEKRVEEQVRRVEASTELHMQRRSVEESLPHASAASKPPPAPAQPRSILVVPPEFELHYEADQAIPHITKGLLSESESKLEALEARFDCSTTVAGTSADLHTTGSREVAVSAVIEEPPPLERLRGGAIDKLRDQLAGLRSELASGLEAPHKERADVPEASARPWDQPLFSDTSQAHASGTDNLGSPIGPVITLPAPSAPMMARASSTPSCHSLLAQSQLIQPDNPAPVKLLQAKEPAVQVHNKWPSQGLQRATSEAVLSSNASVPVVGLDIDVVQAAPTMQSVPTFSASPAAPHIGVASMQTVNSPGTGWPGQAHSNSTTQDTTCLWSTGSRQLC